MTNVIAWPPFGLTGWDIHDSFPSSESADFFQGGSRTSSAQRARRLATAVASGIGPHQAGSGYLRMLNRQWGDKQKLIRADCQSALWHLSAAGAELQTSIMKWTTGGKNMLWSAGGTDLVWFEGAGSGQNGVPDNSGDWPALIVTGLPASKIVVRPADRIQVNNGANSQEAFSLGVVRSDANGKATIYLETPVTISGKVSIGVEENIVFKVLSTPRAVQPVGANWGFTFEMREVFEDEYADGWQEVTPPWGS